MCCLFLLYSSYRECEEVEQWVGEKQLVAANKKLGKDLEHVEILQKKFTDFMHNVLASEDRVLHVNRMADTLIGDNHTGTCTYVCILEYTVIRTDSNNISTCYRK